MLRNVNLGRLTSIAVAFALVALALSLDEAQFKQRLDTEVSTPFSVCMGAYNSALSYLSQLLATYKPEDVMPPAITPQLTTAVDTFVTTIKLSSTNSHCLADATAQAVTQQTNLVSQAQAKIQQNANQISQNQALIAGEQRQVQLAQSALNVAQNNLNTYRAALQNAKDKYDHAKSHCIGKKRRKRGIWHHITHIVHKVVVDIPKKVIHETEKGICKTLNVLTNEINKASHDVDNAQNQVNAANGQLVTARNNLAATQSQLASLQQQQGTLNNQKNQLQAQLGTLKTSRDQIQSIDEKMKRTVTYIDNIKARGAAAKVVIDLGYLIDPANLVQPLSEIGNVMKGLTGKPAEAFLPKMTSAQIQGLLNQINAIKAKVPPS